jgi:mRNA interferase RelE/StbE
MRAWTEPSARGEIKRLPGYMRQRLRQAVKALADEPRPHNSRSLAPPAGVDIGDLELRRLRIEHWRVVYIIDEEWELVVVLAVRKRPPYDYEDLGELLAKLG